MMARTRVFAVCLGAVVATTAMLGSARSGSWIDTIETLETTDRRGAVLAASNVFVGQVVRQDVPCGEAAPFFVYLAVKVERNLKGRLDGTVVVRQHTDDVLEFGPDGRMETGRKYVLYVRYLEASGAYGLVDVYWGYELIEGPEERAEVVAEVRAILEEPIAPTPTVDTDTWATWNAQSTVSAATFGPFPTVPPCRLEGVASPAAT